jgi:Kinesin motor domain
MRPLNPREVNEEHAVSVWKIIENSITLDQQLFNSHPSGGHKFIIPAGAYSSLLAPVPGQPSSHLKAYQFTGCFTPYQKNTDVYQISSIRALVLSSLDGINGTVFMYGQTGAGKTYTMLGSNGLNR